VWRTKVGAAVNTQPLVAHAVAVGGRPRDLVYVGTEHGLVVALDAGSGGVVWQRQLGSRTITPSCGASPDGRFGITATFAQDRGAGRLYAVDANGLTWALMLDSGRVVPGWPVRVHPVGADFVWGGLALSRGRLYVAIASPCDAGRYQGGIVSVDVAHPNRTRFWRTTAGTRVFAGGIWGWGGVAVDDQDGDVYAETGNSAGTSTENVAYGERVVRLSSDLRVEQSNYPLRPPFLAGDRDFGGTPVLFQAPGCPRQLVALNKTGELFLYDRDGISGGPRQRLQVAAPNGVIPLYGLPAYDPATRTLVVVSPTAPPGGRLRRGAQAFRLTKGCRLALLWQQDFNPFPAGSVPTIAGGVVYIEPGRSGTLHALRMSDGRPLWSQLLSPKGAFATATVVDGTVYTADWAGQVWAFRPGAARGGAAAPAVSSRLTRLLILGGIVVLFGGAAVLLRRRV
jgi:outer membrane protein assembly factor BamB